MKGVVVGMMALGLAAPIGVAGQSVAERVSDAGNGTINFRFEVQDDVLICSNGIRTVSDESHYYWSQGRGEREECTDGPMEIRVEMRGGEVRDLDVGMPGRYRGDVDLGLVPAQSAAEFLAEVPWLGGDDDAVGRAYMAARFARDADVTRPVARAVRDRGLSADVRKSVVFWAGQLAADLMSETLRDLVEDEDEDQSLRDHAIFALSQQPEASSVPILMDLARTAPHAKSRRTALFWLAQHDTEEVGEFFAELILGESRGG